MTQPNKKKALKNNKKSLKKRKASLYKRCSFAETKLGFLLKHENPTLFYVIDQCVSTIPRFISNSSKKHIVRVVNRIEPDLVRDREFVAALKEYLVRGNTSKEPLRDNEKIILKYRRKQQSKLNHIINKYDLRSYKPSSKEVKIISL